MKLLEISIKNFKNLSNVKVSFDSDVTTIIGENGSGKTNLFEAISILFDKYSYKKLCESSFSAHIDNFKGHWIIFSARISDIGDSAEETVLIKDELTNEGRINLYYRPKKNIRRKLYELSIKMQESLEGENKNVAMKELKEYIDNIDATYDYEVVYKQYCIFDLDSKDQYNAVVGDFENLVFPNPNDDDSSLLGNEINPSDLLSICNITFIPAIRNATKEFVKEKNILSRLVKNYTNNSNDKTEWDSIQESIKDINDSLGKVNSLNEFSSDLNDQVKKTVGRVYNQGVGYKVFLSEDVNEITRSFELTSEEFSRSLPIDNRSLGENNITYFALKLLENKMLFDTSRAKLNILLIEEPEAHIHKHLQKSLFSGVKGLEGNQIIMSTHSVHISESSQISRVVVLIKDKTSITACNPSKGMNSMDQRIVERYLDTNRIPLLFSKNVMVVEGSAELFLVPAMVKCKYGLDFDEIGVSLVSVDSTFFKPIASLFSNERLKVYCAIITDEDTVFSEDDNENLEEELNPRISLLKKDYQENPYINVFTTKHTFEIDLFLENEDFLLDFIDKQGYFKKGFEKFRKDIKSLNNKPKIDRFYNFVKRIGKGWFAMDLANYLVSLDNTDDFTVPKYICDGLIFVLNKNTSNADSVREILFGIENEKDYFVKAYLEGVQCE